jgi:Flp pilus assembly protein protease CpaA
MIAHVMVMIFPFAMAFAAASDLLTMTIPNKLSLALLGGFLVLAPVAGMPWHEVLAHLGAGAGVLVAGIVLFALGWLGGGDAKLLAVASLWIGPALLLPFLCIVGVLGGGLALVILAYRRMPAGALRCRAGLPDCTYKAAPYLTASPSRRRRSRSIPRRFGTRRFPTDRARAESATGPGSAVNLRRRLTSR